MDFHNMDCYVYRLAV